MAERSLFKALIDQIILRNNRNDYFHRSTILKSSRLFLFYRFWMSSYFIVWFIVQASLEELPKHFIYLTTWGESLLNLYFITSFVMSSYLYWNPESVYDQLNGYVYFLQWMSNFLRIIAFDMGFSLSIAYWLLLRTEDTIFSWHVHLVNSIAIVMDLIVCDNPGNVSNSEFSYSKISYSQFSFPYSIRLVNRTWSGLYITQFAVILLCARRRV